MSSRPFVFGAFGVAVASILSCGPSNVVIGGVAGAVVGDANDVYWVNSGSLWDVALAADTGHPLVSSPVLGQVGAIAIDDQFLYLNTYNLDRTDQMMHTRIVRIVRSGGAPEILSERISRETSAGSIAVDASAIYWTVLEGTASTASPAASTLVRTAKDGSGDTVLVHLAAPFSFGGIAVAAGFVFFTERSEIDAYAGNSTGVVAKVPVLGGPQIVLASGEEYPFAIAVDGSQVYFTNYGSTIRALPLGGGSVRTLADAQSGPASIAVDSTHLYWVNSDINDASMTGHSAVMKMAKAGGVPVEVAPSNAAENIALGGGRIFWSDWDGLKSVPQ